MRTVTINLGNRSYQIHIDDGLLNRAGELLAKLPVGKKVLLVTNPTVAKIYAGMVETSLAQAGFEVLKAVIPDGEESKSIHNAAKLYDIAFAAGMDRECPFVALGGGVVGDLAGFVAATYMRGVPFIQFPTTLLAQVDSSVGGKVAVNHPRGKNIIGAFYQPSLVLSDTSVLKTLAPRETRSGLAEVIKYGIINDRELFEWLEQNMEQVLNLDPKALSYIVERSCINKAMVVEQDETEQGTRAVLNLGHTTGHAIEALAGYGRFTHGEAVAVGIAVAAGISVQLGLLSELEEQRIVSLIKRAGLPVKVPASLKTMEIINSMYGDKKTRGGEITFILPLEVGRVEIRRNVSVEVISEVIETLRE